MNHDYLSFEKPIAELQAKIDELSLVDSDSSININDEIKNLRTKSDKLTERIYSKLSSWQVCQVARHPLRPYTLDYIKHLFTDFEELHGDRLFGDDQSLIGGIAKIESYSVMIIGHQKGRGTNEKIKHNFGMPRPEGYRKARRLMELAQKFKLPVLTFIDTPGAYPGMDSEERGINEAIGKNYGYHVQDKGANNFYCNGGSKFRRRYRNRSRRSLKHAPVFYLYCDNARGLRYDSLEVSI